MSNKHLTELDRLQNSGILCHLTAEAVSYLSTITMPVIFNNFAALQKQLGTEVLTTSTNTKNALLKEVAEYVDVTKSGHSVILSPLTELPRPVAKLNSEMALEGALLLLHEVAKDIDNYVFFRDAERLHLYKGRCKPMTLHDKHSLIYVTFRASELHLLCNWSTKNFYTAKKDHAEQYRLYKDCKSVITFYDTFFLKVKQLLADNTRGVLRLFSRYPSMKLIETTIAKVEGKWEVLTYRDEKLLTDAKSQILAMTKHKRHPIHGYAPSYYEQVCELYNNSPTEKDVPYIDAFSKGYSFVVSRETIRLLQEKFLGIANELVGRKKTYEKMIQRFEKFMEEHRELMEREKVSVSSSVEARFDTGKDKITALERTLEASESWLEWIWNIEDVDV